MTPSDIAKEEYGRWKQSKEPHASAASDEMKQWSDKESFTLKELRARYNLYHPDKKQHEKGVTKIEILISIRERRAVKRKAVKELGIKIKLAVDTEK